MIPSLATTRRLVKNGHSFYVADVPKVTEEHRLARRAQIVAAARTCVIEEGFHKTTMADVIRESGLSAGAVYGYFKSKEEIVAAIAEDALSTIDELFQKILATEQAVTPLMALEAAINHVVAVAERPGGDVTRVAIQAWAEALRNPAIMATACDKYTVLRGNFEAVARSPALRYAFVSASSFLTCALFAETWRVTRSTRPRYCSRPRRPSLSCSTARSYSYCICAIGSASQKILAILLICAMNADQNF